MKFKSALVTSGSGSIGGMTMSRNRGGMFFRSRAIPVNPNTAAQGSARAALASCVFNWSSVLDASQRAAWTAYANNTPVVDVLGDQLILTGQQMFTKSNLPRINGGLPVVENGPATSGLAEAPIVDPAALLSSTTGLTASIEVTSAGTTGRLLTYMSEPASPARNPAHQRRRLVNTSGAPTAGVFTLAISTVDIPWSVVAGQTVRVTYLYLDDDGRVSSEVFQDIVAT